MTRRTYCVVTYKLDGQPYEDVRPTSDEAEEVVAFLKQRVANGEHITDIDYTMRDRPKGR